MKTYCFLGTYASIAGAQPDTVTSFGERFQLPDENVAPALRASVQFIPEVMMPAFTPAELREFFAIPLHGEAPPEFLAKRKAAWDALHDWRESILNPKAPAPAPPAPQVHKEGEI